MNDYIIQNYGPAQQTFPFLVQLNQDESEQRSVMIPGAYRGAPGVSRKLDNAEHQALIAAPKNEVFKKLVEMGEGGGLKIIEARVPQVPEEKPQVEDSPGLSEADKEGFFIEAEAKIEAIFIDQTQGLSEQIDEFKGLLSEVKSLVIEAKSQAEIAQRAASEAGQSTIDAKSSVDVAEKAAKAAEKAYKAAEKLAKG